MRYVTCPLACWIPTHGFRLDNKNTKYKECTACGYRKYRNDYSDNHYAVYHSYDNNDFSAGRPIPIRQRYLR